MSTRVLVRPIGLDMVEVGGSKNATLGAFGPPQQSEGARRVQSPEAMAIEDNPPGPTKFLSLCLLNFFFFETVRVKIQVKQSWCLNLKEKKDDRQ